MASRKNIKTTGLDQFKNQVAKLSEMPNVLDSELANIAKDMQATARAMAPIEYGGLRKSIQYRRVGYQRNKLGQFYKGSLGQHRVFVKLDTPATGRGGMVGDYFYLIHEHMSIGRTGASKLQPSERSVENSAALGEVAGGRFMERARVRYEGRIAQLLKKRADEFIQTLY